MANLAKPYTPVHEWRMDDESGDIVDSIAALNFAMTGDPQYQQAGPDPDVDAIEFDSNDSGIVTVASGGYNADSTGTLFFVFNKGTNNSGNRFFWIVENAAQTASIAIAEVIGEVGIRMNQGSGNISFTRNSIDICDGTYHSVAAVQQGGGSGILIYVDGIDVTQEYNTAGSPDIDFWFTDLGTGADQTVSIGADATPGNYIAESGDATFCQIHHYSEQLSAAEVLALHNEAFGHVPPVPVSGGPGLGGRSLLSKGIRLK